MEIAGVYIRLTNSLGAEIGLITDKKISIDLNTGHGVRAARALAFSLLADGDDATASVIFSLVGRE